MFANFTDYELVALFVLIKAGHDHVYRIFGIANSHHGVLTDASDIMTDIHNENATR